jgi:hypothetical protein
MVFALTVLFALLAFAACDRFAGTDERTTTTPKLSSPTPEEWKTYTNTVYKYQFKYPPSARISEAEKSSFSVRTEEVKQGITVEDVYKKYTGKICVSTQYRFGYVKISAPPNKYFAYVICGRTGVGAYTVTSKEEVVVIDGKTYTAKGYEVKGPGNTLDYHNETFNVTLEDGTTIEYGALPTEKATFEDYLTIKGELLKIVESFSSFK